MYLVKHQGAMLVISSKYSEIDWTGWLCERASIIKQVFGIHVRTPSEFQIGIDQQVSGMNLAIAIRVIVDHIYSIDSAASISGRFDYTGDDVEDSGYVVIDNHKVDVFMRVAVYVHEDNYVPVMNIINTYLASDMKEFIAEGVRHEPL